MENSPPAKRKTRRGKRQNKDDVVSREYLRRQSMIIDSNKEKFRWADYECRILI